jgi:hypothetical protein
LESYEWTFDRSKEARKELADHTEWELANDLTSG